MRIFNINSWGYGILTLFSFLQEGSLPGYEESQAGHQILTDYENTYEAPALNPVPVSPSPYRYEKTHTHLYPK